MSSPSKRPRSSSVLIQSRLSFPVQKRADVSSSKSSRKPISPPLPPYSSTKCADREFINFLRSLEMIAETCTVMLNKYNEIISTHCEFPLCSSSLDSLLVQLKNSHLFDSLQLTRIHDQLLSLGSNGDTLPRLINTECREIVLSSCRKCSTTKSFLRTLCSVCGCHSESFLSISPNSVCCHWDKIRERTKEIQTSYITHPASPATKVYKENKLNKFSDFFVPGERQSRRLSSRSLSHELSSEFIGHTEFTFAINTDTFSPPDRSPGTLCSPPPSISSPAVPASSPLSHSDLSVLCVQSALRSIEYLRCFILNAKKKDFYENGGDIIFLLRNAIFRSSNAKIRSAANSAVREMIQRWNTSESEDGERSNELDNSSSPGHLLVYIEAIHAQLEMGMIGAELETEEQKKVQRERILQRICSCTAQQSIEEILRFDPSASNRPPTSKVGYCMNCGKYGEKMNSTECIKPACLASSSSTLLMNTIDFNDFTEALVWSSLYRDIGLPLVHCSDASASLIDVCSLIPQLRPYRSFSALSHDLYVSQFYFLTHLLFILSGWGAVSLPQICFLEEIIFLQSQMDLLIKLKHYELIGECLESMRILEIPERNIYYQRGICFLLENEKSSQSNRGNWCSAGANYYDRYHTAYCGVIGLGRFEFNAERDVNKHFPEEIHQLLIQQHRKQGENTQNY